MFSERPLEFEGRQVHMICFLFVGLLVDHGVFHEVEHSVFGNLLATLSAKKKQRIRVAF